MTSVVLKSKILEVICISDQKCPHHLIGQDAAQFVLVQKQQPLQTNQLIGLQFEPGTGRTDRQTDSVLKLSEINIKQFNRDKLAANFKKKLRIETGD